VTPAHPLKETIMRAAIPRLLVVLLGLLAPAPAVAGPAASPEGTWLGALAVGGATLHLAFHVTRAPDGALVATLDSIDQGARGIPVDKVSFDAPTVRLELTNLGGVFAGTLDGDVLVGTWTQGGRALPLAMKRGEAVRPRRPQEPTHPFPYREEEVTLDVTAAPLDPAAAGSRVTLAGTLTLPPGRGPFPAVLFVTGSGPEDRDETVFDHKPFLVLADALTRAGIATLRFDDRGTGKSGGSLEGLTTLDFVEDALAELDLLARRPEIDRRALGIIGHSEGGIIAPIAATRSPLVKMVVLLAGTGMTGDQVLLDQGELIARAAGAPEPELARQRAENARLYAAVRAARGDAEIDAAVQAFTAAEPAQRAEREATARALRSPWLRMFLRLDPVPYLEKLAVPVLAIGGDKDLQVPRANLRSIEAALRRGKNPDATVKLFPGLNHLFQHAKTGQPSEYAASEETFAPEALKLVQTWLVERAKRLRR
jgi:hypothetical protein